MTFLDPPRRNDLTVELFELLDGSGDYTGDWLDTSGVQSVRVSASFNGGAPTVSIEEAQFDTSHSGDPRVIRTQSVPVASLHAWAQLDLSARYYRLTVSGGSADNPFAATIRVV